MAWCLRDPQSGNRSAPRVHRRSAPSTRLASSRPLIGLTGEVGGGIDRCRQGGVRLTVTGVVISLVLGACGVSGSPSGSTLGASVPTSATGCGSTAKGSTTLTPVVAGHVRTVIVHVPSNYTASAKVPLLLNLHGSGSTAADEELFTGMDNTADAHGIIVAYPQALIPDGSGFDWNVPGVPLIGGRAVPADAADDVTFLTQLVGILEHRYCIDPARV